MAKISTLVDNFNDNSIDIALWDTYSYSGASVTEELQQLKFTIAAGAGNYAQLHSKVDYDFTESNTACRLIQALDQHSSHENYFFMMPGAENPQDPQNYEGWYISNGNIIAVKRVAGTTTFMWSEAYVAATHAWVRLRHTGSLLYFDTAPSTASNPPIEADWVNKYSVTPAHSMTALRLQFNGGAYDALNAGDVGFWDSLHSTSNVVNYSMPATVGAFALSSGSTILRHSPVFNAAASAFTLGQNSAGLNLNYRFLADNGIYALSLQNANLSYGFTLYAQPQAFVLGTPNAKLITFIADFRMKALWTEFFFGGGDVTLTPSSGAPVLAAGNSPTDEGYSYSVAKPPETESIAEVLSWALQELEKASNVINNVAEGRVSVLHAAPEKPRDGLIRMADGTNWNPGNGRGYYGFDEASNSWIFLGQPAP